MAHIEEAAFHQRSAKRNCNEDTHDSSQYFPLSCHHQSERRASEEVDALPGPVSGMGMCSTGELLKYEDKGNDNSVDKAPSEEDYFYE